MGKIDIDYSKLHDAFFRWQTKPKMTPHGDLYFEGKEMETRLSNRKPGNLSKRLKEALGMPTLEVGMLPMAPWSFLVTGVGYGRMLRPFRLPGCYTCNASGLRRRIPTLPFLA